MLTVAVLVVALGVASLLAGCYGTWLFREGRGAPRDTISGGFYLGGTWNRRIGLVLLIAGLPMLVTAIAWEIVT